MGKTYKGQVFSGKGVGTTRVKQNLETYIQASGKSLIPGTLNIRLTEDFEVPQKHIYIPPEQIKPIEKERGITLIHARINGEGVIIMVPDRPIYEKNVMEIMASFNIGEKFNLKDGDEIEVLVE